MADNKKKRTRLTLEQLIAAKEQREKDRLMVKEIDIPALGGSLLFKRPSDELIFDLVESVQKDDSLANSCDQYATVLHACCDQLRDPELREALDVSNPVDVVYAILDAGDIVSVGDQVCQMNSLYQTAEESVKNS